MNKTIQKILRGKDTDFDNTSPKRIKMVRHADSRTIKKKGEIPEDKKLLIHGQPFPSNIVSLKNLYLYRKDLFLQYQGEQLKNTFNNIDYIVSFIGEQGTTARFIAVYKIKGQKPSPYNQKEILLDLEKVKTFEDIEETILIDWGKATTSWHQYYYNAKAVISDGLNKYDIKEAVTLPDYYLDIILSYDELKNVIDTPVWVEKLKSSHCIYAILDNNNGKLYVGSTYGYNGIYGRWKTYAETGHGGNKDLKKIAEEKGESYISNNFQWTILETIPLDISPNEAINRESKWKQKLGTIIHGYNNN